MDYGPCNGRLLCAGLMETDEQGEHLPAKHAFQLATKLLKNSRVTAM
jgi:hypothetical protein